MSRQNAQRARPRSLGKRLTPKQAAFTHHYSNRKSDTFGNGTRSCKRSGYKGHAGTLAVQASRNLRHPAIREEVRTALYKQGFTPEFAAKTLMGAMRATVVRALPNRKGKPVLHRFPDHRTRLQGYDRACRLAGAIEDEQGYEADAEFEPDPRTSGGEYWALGQKCRAGGREYWSESEGWVANPYAGMSPTDLMFARSFTENVVTAIKLTELMGGTQAEAVASMLKSAGIGSTDGASQAGNGQPDRPAFGPVGEGP